MNTEQILDLIRSSEKLEAIYPDHEDERASNWYLVVYEEESDAEKLASAAAQDGWVTALWNTRFNNYVTAIYIPDDDLTNLMAKSGTDSNIYEMCMGVPRMIEMGQDPIVILKGTWNWGTGTVIKESRLPKVEQ